VGGCFKAPGRALAMFQQYVHRREAGIAALVNHASPYALLEGVGQLLERLVPTASGPTDPTQQIRLSLNTVIFLSCFAVKRTRHHLQAQGLNTF